MMTPDPNFVATPIAAQKVEAVLGFIVAMAEGPREAYGILTCALHALNFRLLEEPSSIDDLCAEVSTTLRSITEARKNDLQ
jgi:hypothetical protein